jgi:hypothetical protein
MHGREKGDRGRECNCVRNMKRVEKRDKEK